MGLQHGPLSPVKGSEVWALNLYRVETGYRRGMSRRKTKHLPGPSLGTLLGSFLN